MADEGSREFPRGVEVVVAVILRKDDVFAMIRSTKWENKWAFAGGHIEPGESIFAAAEREGKEETGLDSKGVAITASGDAINPPGYHRPIHYVYFHVVCDYVSGELAPQEEEATDAQWFTAAEIDKLIKQNETIQPTAMTMEHYTKWLKEQA